CPGAKSARRDGCFERKIVFPDLELILHSGPWTQPRSSASSNSSLSRPSLPVKYFFKLPFGKGGLPFHFYRCKRHSAIGIAFERNNLSGFGTRYPDRF